MCFSAINACIHNSANWALDKLSYPIVKKLEVATDVLKDIGAISSTAVALRLAYKFASPTDELADPSLLRSYAMTMGTLIIALGSAAFLSAKLNLFAKENLYDRCERTLTSPDQDSNKPLFLIIQPKSDSSGAFESPLDINPRLADRYQFKTIKVADLEQFKLALESSPKKVSVLCIRGHGCPIGIELGEGRKGFFSIGDIHSCRDVFSKILKQGTKIFLDCCLIAQDHTTPLLWTKSKNFAQELSLYATVFGPDEVTTDGHIDEDGVIHMPKFSELESLLGRNNWACHRLVCPPNSVRAYQSGQELSRDEAYI